MKNKNNKIRFGFNKKIILIFLLLSILPISIIGFVSVSYTIKALEKEAFERFDSYNNEVKRIDVVLSKVKSSTKNLADFATNIYNNQHIFYRPDNWSTDSLFQAKDGQYGNSADQDSSVIVFNWVDFNDKIKNNLTLSANLDFLFSSIKQENKNINSLYIIGDNYSWYRMYPNYDAIPEIKGGVAIDLLPADLNKDGADSLFWDNLGKELNPNKETRWSPPYVDVTGHGLVTSVLAPVYNDDKMVALVGADMKLSDITNRIANIKLWKTGYAFLIDSQARAISFPVRAGVDLEYEKENLKISEIRKYNLLENIKNQDFKNIIAEMIKKEHIYEPKIVEFNKIKKYIVSHPIKNTGWVLGFVVPVNEVIEGAILVRNFIIGILLLAVFLLLIIIFFGSKLITEPINKLMKGVEEISKGNLSYKININTKDEIQVLGEKFNQMAVRLKKYYATLEQKVKQRTFQLAQAKNEIEREKNRIQAMLSSIGDGVFVIDNNKKLILINPAGEKISGFKEIDSIGKEYSKIFKFLKEDDNSENNDFINTAIKLGNTTNMHNHTMLINNNKNKIPIACSSAPIIDENKNIIGAVIVFRDITQEREIERIKSEFVSLASHQLRTPATIIKWGVEIILKQRKGKADKNEIEQIQRVHRGAERMIELVNDLLNVSRMESKRLVFDLKQIQLEELTKKIMQEYKPYLKKKKARVVFNKTAKLLPKIEADTEKMRQIIIIFLDNAIKYSPEGEEITIEIKKHEEKKQIIYSVKDNGVGIPDKEKNKIFNRFFRAENVSQKPGTGLGLYLAKGLIEAFNGEIGFESEENKGTTFYFKLPYNK